MWIGPWRPVPPGDCHCSAINDEITRWKLDCPQHGNQPVIPAHHVELMDPHRAATPAEVWRAVSAQADRALGTWHTRDVRPAFVGDRIVWICATFIRPHRRVRAVQHRHTHRRLEPDALPHPANHAPTDQGSGMTTNPVSFEPRVQPGDIAMLLRQADHSGASPIVAQDAILAALRQAGLLPQTDAAADERALAEFRARGGQLLRPIVRRYGRYSGWM
ncbi:hypothetical protein [Nocardia beijingensis]|uniref:TniQ protein n=1 Tax=Nocardia beijingensis TaxID=95162 RepID=A0ABW7W7W7_9NOCA